MKSFTYIILNKIGIHARPAGLLVNEAKKYASDITLSYNGKTVDCRKLMSVMSLGVKSDEEVRVNIDGADEEEAYKGLMNFFRENL